MPTTVIPSSRQAESVDTYEYSVQKSLALLEGACKIDYQKCSELLKSSFDNSALTIKPSPNGFVHGAIAAYNNHHHLQLRPDDIWFAILGQISLYINSHAEELRGKFVDHKEKKELFVLSNATDRHLIDFGMFAKVMSNEIDKCMVDRDLKEWVMPAFSTTTKQDEVVASVLLMGSLREYFGYTCVMRCGLPSVTLLGEKADWEKILSRLDKLKEFGNEPTQFYARLRPVISRFILSFDEPNSDEVKSFWNRITHTCELGSGPIYYSGWISAFCFWNLKGRIQYLKHNPNIKNDGYSRARFGNPPEPLRLDGVVYDAINSNDFPPGYSSVPFKIDDNGEIIDAIIIAGSVGLKCTKSNAKKRHEDTISAETGWWVFETKPEEDTIME